jgi:hypothetical protein
MVYTGGGGPMVLGQKEGSGVSAGCSAHIERYV